MKTLLAAATIALVPTLAAADMHAFDYSGTGNPVAIVESAAQPKLVQAAPATMLPSPLFLTRQSDFSVFFKPGIPAAIQKQALRVLWAAYPELAQADSAATQAVSYPTGPLTTVAALQQ